METTRHESYTEVKAAEGMVLHRVGTGYEEKPPRMACGAINDGDYEELTVGEYAARRLEAYRAKQYSERLSLAIHERYSLDDEIALAANVNSPMLLDDGEKAAAVASEWQEYQRFRQECKERVRAEVDAITEVPGTPEPDMPDSGQQ